MSQAIPYVTQAEMVGRVPDEYLKSATGDTDPDAGDSAIWQQVSDDVDQEINGRLASSYATPLTTIPDNIRAAAKTIAAYFLFKRRNVSDEKNPWTELFNYWTKQLDKIGAGTLPLTFDATHGKAPILVISEPARTHSASGSLMV